MSKSIYTQRTKKQKVTNALRRCQTEMSLKVVQIAQIQCQAVAV